MLYYRSIARRWFANLRSVELVITPDQSKWSQAPVIEMGRNPAMNEGGASRFQLRQHSSLNKDGSYDNATIGWGWFPGYAIDLESGQRLTIVYAENSSMAEENGADMIWNPTPSRVTSEGLRVGGEHYIYILNLPYGVRTLVYNLLANRNPGWDTTFVNWAMWVGVPLGANMDLWKPVAEGLVPTEARIRLIVSSPFRRSSTGTINNGYPVYEFNTIGMAPVTGDIEKLKSMLDSIMVVPNPYYGFSAYEQSRIDNHVKITNLPPGAEVTIYSIDGTLIRRMTYQQSGTSTLGDDQVTGSLVWDLKNEAGIPISSGLYLIHVKVEGVGERIVKFFAIMRPVDIQNF